MEAVQCWNEWFGEARPGAPLVFLLAGEPDELMVSLRPALEPAIAQGNCPAFLLAGFAPVDWDRDYSPWPAQDSQGRAFAGEANALLPRVRETAAQLQARHSLGNAVYPVGYSLGGLAALYFHCEAGFSGCGSCSGSLWYPGWLEYLKTRAPGGKIYLSLGGKEKNARDPLMRTVEDATIQTKALLSSSARCTFVHEPGGHFRDVPQRLARAILWLLGA